jgi:hypothetical protein
MKKLFCVLAFGLLLTFVGNVYATPFIVCNPQAGVQFYKITGDPFWTANVTAQTDGSIKTDIAGISSGSHSINVAACITDTSFGEVCSATAPFTFVKPAGPTAPVNLRLSTQ